MLFAICILFLTIRVSVWIHKGPAFCWVFICLILFFTSQSTFFQSCWDRSSWIKPVLSRGHSLAKGHKAVPLVRLIPATLQSQVKHSTTEPRRSSFVGSIQDQNCLQKLSADNKQSPARRE